MANRQEIPSVDQIHSIEHEFRITDEFISQMRKVGGKLPDETNFSDLLYHPQRDATNIPFEWRIFMGSLSHKHRATISRIMRNPIKAGYKKLSETRDKSFESLVEGKFDGKKVIYSSLGPITAATIKAGFEPFSTPHEKVE